MAGSRQAAQILLAAWDSWKEHLFHRLNGVEETRPCLGVVGDGRGCGPIVDQENVVVQTVREIDKVEARALASLPGGDEPGVLPKFPVGDLAAGDAGALE